MNVKKDNCNKKKGIGFYIMCSVFILSFILLLYLCETTIVGWIGMFLVVSMLLLCRRTRFWKGILIPVFWVASISMVGLAFSVSNKISIMGAFSNKVIVRIAMRMPNDFADKLYNKKEVLLINKKNANTDWTAPEGYTFKKIKLNNFTLDVLSPKSHVGDKVILQLHGGGFIFGINDTYRKHAVKYSSISGNATVVSPDYRTAYIAPYPAAFEDCVATYRWLLSNGYKSENIIIGGDSAGGSLALSTTLYLKNHDIPLPAGVIVWSPSTDFSLSTQSCYDRADRDFIMGATFGKGRIDLDHFPYLLGSNCDLKDPYLSPVYGDYSGFPKLLMQVGTEEILYDDTILVANKARVAGVEVTQTTYEGMFHTFPILENLIPESTKAWSEMEKFISDCFEK